MIPTAILLTYNRAIATTMALTDARALPDARRYVAEVWLENPEGIKAAWAKIAEIEALARSNGAYDALVAARTGEPAAPLSEAERRYIAEWSATSATTLD